MPADSHLALWTIFSDWHALVLMLNYVVSFGGFLAIGNFLPNHLLKYHETDDTVTLLITAAFLTLVCVKRVLYGPLTDKLEGPNSTILGMVVTGIGAFIFASSPRGNFWDWRPISGLFILTSGMGCAASGTFKWIPLAFPGNTGPIGGAVGSIGALGGFILSTILGAMGGEAKSIHLFTGLVIFMIVLDGILDYQEYKEHHSVKQMCQDRRGKSVVFHAGDHDLITAHEFEHG